MEPPGARRHPDLARGAVAVDDHARAIGVFDLEHAALFALDVHVDAALFEGRFDALERLVGAPSEFVLVHCVNIVILCAYSPLSLQLRSRHSRSRAAAAGSAVRFTCATSLRPA